MFSKKEKYKKNSPFKVHIADLQYGFQVVGSIKPLFLLSAT